MTCDDPAWEDFTEFVRSRPETVQRLMANWPPLATVMTRPGVVLLIPAPGVEGTIYSYFEDDSLGVVAPVTIPHPEHGWGDTRPGEMVKAHVGPEHLVLVREGRWTRADVREALAGGAR